MMRIDDDYIALSLLRWYHEIVLPRRRLSIVLMSWFLFVFSYVTRKYNCV